MTKTVRTLTLTFGILLWATWPAWAQTPGQTCEEMVVTLRVLADNLLRSRQSGEVDAAQQIARHTREIQDLQGQIRSMQPAQKQNEETKP